MTTGKDVDWTVTVREADFGQTSPIELSIKAPHAGAACSLALLEAKQKGMRNPIVTALSMAGAKP